MSGRRMIWLCLLAAGLGLGATQAAAQCCAPPPPCCAPPPPPPPPSGPCCGGPRVVVPGVNVSVQSTAIAVSTASARAGASGQAGAGVFIGGGGSWYVEQPTPTLIQNLNVEAEAEASVRAVAVQRQRTVRRRVIVQAVCLDDKAVPHPASQVRPDREVADDYVGEVWRCIGGTRLQATVAEWRGEDRVDGGETIGCEKLQALHHAPGGALECRAQTPARDCNERSLLRRYGAGTKLMTVARTETYTDREEAAAAAASARASAGGSLMLDGGVGGVVR